MESLTVHLIITNNNYFKNFRENKSDEYCEEIANWLL
jgi:hypothetical protein